VTDPFDRFIPIMYSSSSKTNPWTQSRNKLNIIRFFNESWKKHDSQCYAFRTSIHHDIQRVYDPISPEYSVIGASGSGSPRFPAIPPLLLCASSLTVQIVTMWYCYKCMDYTTNKQKIWKSNSKQVPCLKCHYLK
jgi:hypothetical protein